MWRFFTVYWWTLKCLNFVTNSTCNLGFLIYILCIFLANLIVLQVYGQEMAIRARNRKVGAKITETTIIGQQSGATELAACIQFSRDTAPQCWTAEAVVLVAWNLPVCGNCQFWVILKPYVESSIKRAFLINSRHKK